MPVHFSNDIAVRSAAKSGAHHPASYDRSAEVARVKASKKNGPRPGKRVRRHRKWPIVLVIILVVLVGVGASGYALYKDVQSVKADATAAIAQVPVLENAIKTNDTATIASSAADVEARATRMHKTTSGILWNIASVVPYYGEDVRIAQALTSTVDDLSTNALAPLATQLSTMSLANLVGTSGAIDVTSLTNLVLALDTVSPVVQRSADSLNTLGTSHFSQLNDPLQKVKEAISSASSLLSTASSIAPVLPQMLGANGKTVNYLILAQSNAEIRATGGFPGSWGLLRVTDGKLTMEKFEQLGTTITWFDPNGGYGLTDQELSLFTSTPSYVPGDAGMIPDFSRASQIWQWEWQQKAGVTVDGIIAVDPMFLQQLMGLVGGVTLSDGTILDGTNTAKALLHDSYWALSFTKQDLFFQEAAQACMQKLISSLGSVQPTALVETLSSSAATGGIKVWMADAAQEQLMVELGLSGAISQDAASPVVGVYLSDFTYAKIDWFLSAITQVGAPVRNADGTTSYQVTTTISNTMTAAELAEALGLPTAQREYILGATNYKKRAEGDMITQVHITAPAGGSISNILVSAPKYTAGDIETYMGVGIYGVRVWNEPGESSTITYTITTAANAASSLKVYTTPLCQ